MTVAELIEKLQEMPSDLKVFAFYTDPDGVPVKSEADVEWVSGSPDYVVITG